MLRSIKRLSRSLNTNDNGMEGRAGEEKKVNGKSKNLKYINKITMYGEKSKKRLITSEKHDLKWESHRGVESNKLCFSSNFSMNFSNY